MDDEEDILPMDSGPVRPELVSEPTIVDEPEEREAQPRAPDGKFASKEQGEKPADEAASAPPAPEPEAVPVKALQDERRKRQELEAQLAALQQQAAQQPPPSIWEDDQGALAHVQEQAVSQAVQQATFNARLDMSEMMVRQANPDFDEMKSRFLAMAEENPALRQMALKDPHPWNKAYTLAKNAAKMEALGTTDVGELEARLRAKWEAELAAKMPRPSFPTSTANDGSVSNRGAVFQPSDFKLPMDS